MESNGRFTIENAHLESSTMPPTRPVEPASWLQRSNARSLRKFLVTVAEDASSKRPKEVVSFARQALSDDSFPADATTVIRYLATHFATATVLGAARKLLAEYRAWVAAGFNQDFHDASFTNPRRAEEVRAALAESQRIVGELYREDWRS